MFPFRRYRQFLTALRQNRNFCSPICGSIVKRHHSQLESPLRQRIAVSVTTNQQNTTTTSQQSIRIRSYTRTQTYEAECWNCKKATERKSRMLCAECGHLQEVNAEMNYFDLLGCPQGFNVEPQQLTRHFRQLQTIVHPDKFSNKSEREQTNSADWSSLINKAYKTLATPIERGQYLLRLHGLQVPEDNSALDKEFLMEMMERNEEVEDATTEDELRQLDERIVNEMNENANKLISQFDGSDLKGAMATLIQMKYLRSLQRSIKSKLQSSIY